MSTCVWFEAPYDKDDFKTAIKRTRLYACAGNFFWHDIAKLSTPGVPVNENSVMKYKNRYFKAGPKRMLDPIHLVVGSGIDPMTRKGALRRVSP